jgi:diguanylate cyclase (GGDEF)-like protein
VTLSASHHELTLRRARENGEPTVGRGGTVAPVNENAAGDAAHVGADDVSTVLDVEAELLALTALLNETASVDIAIERVGREFVDLLRARGCRVSVRVGNWDHTFTYGVDPAGPVPGDGPVVVTTGPLIVRGATRGDIAFVDVAPELTRLVHVAATVMASVVHVCETEGRLRVERARVRLLSFASRHGGDLDEAAADELRTRLLEVPGVVRVAVALGGHVALPERGENVRATIGTPPDNIEVAVALDGRQSVALNTREVVQDALEVVREVHEREAQLLALRDQLAFDSLTHVGTRTIGVLSLEHALARAARLREPVSVVVLNVDHLAAVNDDRGSIAGDDVLRALAFVAETATRLYDSVARLDDDEFLVVLAGTEAHDATLVAERVRRLTAEHLRVSGFVPSPTVSAGVSAYPVNGDDAATLITAAQEAVRAAKNEGRDRMRTAGEEQ